MSTEKARMRLVSAFEDPSVVTPSTSIATSAPCGRGRKLGVCTRDIDASLLFRVETRPLEATRLATAREMPRAPRSVFDLGRLATRVRVR
jgi:hypothetical protein